MNTEVPSPARRTCVGCAASLALLTALLACALGGLAVRRGGDPPELHAQIGTLIIRGYTTVAPSCLPLVACNQRFADVPLPHYYVIWCVWQDGKSISAANTRRVLTVPLLQR